MWRLATRCRRRGRRCWGGRSGGSRARGSTRARAQGTLRRSRGPSRRRWPASTRARPHKHPPRPCPLPNFVLAPRRQPTPPSPSPLRHTDPTVLLLLTAVPAHRAGLIGRPADNRWAGGAFDDELFAATGTSLLPRAAAAEHVSARSQQDILGKASYFPIGVVTEVTLAPPPTLASSTPRVPAHSTDQARLAHGPSNTRPSYTSGRRASPCRSGSC
jgi:hypothetical protein